MTVCNWRTSDKRKIMREKDGEKGSLLQTRDGVCARVWLQHWRWRTECEGWGMLGDGYTCTVSERSQFVHPQTGMSCYVTADSHPEFPHAHAHLPTSLSLRRLPSNRAANATLLSSNHSLTLSILYLSVEKSVTFSKTPDQHAQDHRVPN